MEGYVAGFLISLLCVITLSSRRVPIDGRARRLSVRDRRAMRRVHRGCCYACAYDLRGLAQGARCPECGTGQPLIAPITPATQIVLDTTVMLKLLVVTGVAATIGGTFAWLVGVACAWSYEVQGYGTDVAYAAMRFRGFDLPDEVWLYNPLGLLLMLSPFLALFRPWRRFRNLLLIIFGAGFVLGLPWLFGGVWIVYGR